MFGRSRLVFVLPAMALLLIAVTVISTQNDVSAQSSSQTFNGDVFIAPGGNLGVGTADPKATLHVNSQGDRQAGGANAVIFGKDRDPVNSVRYSFWDVGGLISDQDGGAFWRGYHLSAPGITVDGNPVWPRLGWYAEYDQENDPAHRQWVIESTNSNGDDERHDIIYRISHRDILYLDDTGKVGINLEGRAPTEALEVGGNLRLAGQLHLTDNVVTHGDICFGTCS